MTPNASQPLLQTRPGNICRPTDNYHNITSPHLFASDARQVLLLPLDVANHFGASRLDTVPVFGFGHVALHGYLHVYVKLVSNLEQKRGCVAQFLGQLGLEFMFAAFARLVALQK